MTKPIIRKAFLNKRNKQLVVTIPKKQMKANNPHIKFGEDLFVELRIFKGGKK